ncbi:hypothetical protein DFH06DRAFT_1308167 [Mycena polygramma]|nr:hypothetical protein DFH06DRAFT_1308167 [Mycena polygramma]
MRVDGWGEQRGMKATKVQGTTRNGTHHNPIPLPLLLLPTASTVPTFPSSPTTRTRTHPHTPQHRRHNPRIPQPRLLLQIHTHAGRRGHPGAVGDGLGDEAAVAAAQEEGAHDDGGGDAEEEDEGCEEGVYCGWRWPWPSPSGRRKKGGAQGHRRVARWRQHKMRPAGERVGNAGSVVEENVCEKKVGVPLTELEADIEEAMDVADPDAEDRALALDERDVADMVDSPRGTKGNRTRAWSKTPERGEEGVGRRRGRQRAASVRRRGGETIGRNEMRGKEIICFAPGIGLILASTVAVVALQVATDSKTGKPCNSLLRNHLGYSGLPSAIRGISQHGQDISPAEQMRFEPTPQQFSVARNCLDGVEHQKSRYKAVWCMAARGTILWPWRTLDSRSPCSIQGAALVGPKA